MSNEINWQDRIGEEFYLKSDKPDGQKYTVINVDPDDNNRIVFEREDSWTFTAVNPVITADNTIEWDYSVAGRFTDESRVQEQYNKTHSLKTMLEKSAYENIVVYNKYGDFLCEGNPQELRKNGLWALLDEQNAVVKESYHGFTEKGEPAMCFELRNFPLKDRSRAELQAQLTALQENADFTDIIEDDLRNERINEFNMRVGKLKEHIESARFSELRKEAENIDSLWYVDKDTGRISNIYFNSDSDAGGTFVENVIYAKDLLEIMQEPIEVFGEPVSEYFLDFFDGCGNQTNIDIDSCEFEGELNKLKDDVQNELYAFKGDTEETMLGLIEIAENIVEKQSKLAWKSEKVEQLNNAKANYGEESFEYEYLKNELSLSMEEYANLLSSISAELKKQDYDNADTSAQDFLNDYTKKIDIHPFPEDLPKIVNFIKEQTVKQMPDTELIKHFLEKSRDLTDYTAYEEMKSRNLISKDDTFATLGQKLDYYKKNPQFANLENVAMKDFTLIIDTSAANDEGSQLYVYEADTLQEAKDKLAELNLSFNQGDVYCVTIGERNRGTLNRYQQTERTDDGIKWYADNSNGHEYIPFEWKKVDDWLNIEKFQVIKPAQNTNLTEEISMENNITARVTPIENGSNLKGSATVVINDQFAVHGIKIVEGEKGLFISMPAEKSKSGRFYDTIRPASEKGHEILTATVLAAYQDALVNGKQQKADLNPSELSVKVSNFRPNPYENNIKGDCQIVINDTLVVKGVKVIATRDSGELSVALPSKQDQFGGYIPVANAITPDFFAQIKTAVVDYYQNPPQKLGNTSYGKLADKSAGEEVIHKTYNSQFAEKVGEQLNADGIKWSAKIEDNGKTVISVNKNDKEKLDNAAEKAKPPKAEVLSTGEIPATPAPRKK